MSKSSRLPIAILSPIAALIIAATPASSVLAQTSCAAPELTSPDGAALFAQLSSGLLVREDLPRPADAAPGAQLWRPAPPMPTTNEDVAVANARIRAMTQGTDFEASVAQYKTELHDACRLLGARSTFIGQVPLEVDSQIIQFGNPDAARAYLDYAAAQINGTPVTLDSDVVWQPTTVQPVGDDTRALSATTSAQAASPAVTATTILFRVDSTVGAVAMASSDAPDLATARRAEALAQISATRIAHAGLSAAAGNN